MTAAVAHPETSPEARNAREPNEIPTAAPAPWWARAVALIVDVVPGLAVAATMALVVVTVPLHSLWWWLCLCAGGLAILLTAGNRTLLPAVTGWSLGRAALGIELVSTGRPQPVSAGRLLLRELAHVLDTASVLVGWLWPLWDRRGRTFADLLVRTEARRAGPSWPRPPKPAALVAAVFLAAALLCMLGAAISFEVVYHYGRESEHTRAQIASQGPKIVEQMLSYYPDTWQDDFAHAQSLTTDNYREQLLPEQGTVRQAIEQGRPFANEYKVTNSAVLSAEPDRATMLLAMQGQRGDEKTQRLISATVRVIFVEQAGQWRVDDLIVVTKPLPPEDGN